MLVADLGLRNVSPICFDHYDLYLTFKYKMITNSTQIDYVMRKIVLQGIQNYVQAHYILICIAVQNILNDVMIVIVNM